VEAMRLSYLSMGANVWAAATRNLPGMPGPHSTVDQVANAMAEAAGQIASSPANLAGVKNLLATELLHPTWVSRYQAVDSYVPAIVAAEAVLNTLQEHHEKMNHFTVENMIVDEAMIRISEKTDAWKRQGRDIAEAKRAAVAEGDKDFTQLVQIEEAQRMLHQATRDVLDTAEGFLRVFQVAASRWCDVAAEKGRVHGWKEQSAGVWPNLVLLETGSRESEDLGAVASESPGSSLAHVSAEAGEAQGSAGGTNRGEVDLAAVKACLEEDPYTADGWAKRLTTIERTIKVLAPDYEADHHSGAVE